ncbi:lysophospholipid acyltransferase family protein [Alteromonas sp. a30]|nr:lysophospholipid acyltransferase family protein [Alteromonas sp. a30]
MQKRISLGELISQEKQNGIMKLGIRLGDRLLGLHKMRALYQNNGLEGLSKEEFSDKLLEALNITLDVDQKALDMIPKEGPLLLASNHPFGGIEGVILARVISQVRPDLKVLANTALRVFSELTDYFIFTNPLAPKNAKNAPSLKQTIGHLKRGGALLIFPAGKVSFYDVASQRVVEHEWNRLVGRMLQIPQIQYTPIFASGKNSDWFYRVERLNFKLRMFFLGWELLNKKNQNLRIDIGHTVSANRIETQVTDKELAALARAQSYALEPEWRSDWPVTNAMEFSPLAAPIDVALLQKEIADLPAKQHLVEYRNFSVYYGYREQIPNVVLEIARLRERVFREHNEGSGNSRDTDHFDDTYTHLFVVNNDTHELVGAYRMGQTDRLLANYAKDKDDLSPIYLAQMFNFQPGFINRKEPCLEMGRSFLTPEYQRSFHGLYLLWRGIGAFCGKFPQYRYLYGTVSLSKLFDKRSIAIIKAALVEETDNVSPKHDFDFALHPEIQAFHQDYHLRSHMSSFLQAIETDGKDIPILLKHYMKLNANFHALGVDKNFADTPGLLLSVHLPSAPQKLVSKYLADEMPAYLAYS